jgi:oligogalacturonide lyase
VEWTDSATGHRVLRLSQEPGSRSLYFHQNAFTATGDKMVFSGRRGFSVINLKTREIRPLIDHAGRGLVIAKKSREAFYIDGETVHGTHLDTGATRTIAKIPREYASGAGLTLNADETMLAGTAIEPGKRPAGTGPRPRSLEDTFQMHLPRLIHTIGIPTGTLKVIHRGNDWFNHLQFSPADPGLLMFCHEGPWHKLDRIWTIRTDGSGLRKIHTRTMDMEIAGHEFWNPDGKIIWYDLQTPKGKEFWLAGAVFDTGEKIRYPVARDQWSVHYNVSWDGSLFAGDGGGPQMVAKAKDGQWIQLFRPKDGALECERLVTMAAHDYKLEPNVRFSPDGRWIVFHSNMHGPSHVYAVEVKKETKKGSD